MAPTTDAWRPPSLLFAPDTREGFPYSRSLLTRQVGKTGQIGFLRLRTCDRMIFLAGSEVWSWRVCCQIRERTKPFVWPSACAERSKPPPFRLGSMQLPQPSAG